jgi:hypothetical protein
LNSTPFLETNTQPESDHPFIIAFSADAGHARDGCQTPRIRCVAGGQTEMTTARHSSIAGIGNVIRLRYLKQFAMSFLLAIRQLSLSFPAALAASAD